MVDTSQLSHVLKIISGWNVCETPAKLQSAKFNISQTFLAMQYIKQIKNEE